MANTDLLLLYMPVIHQGYLRLLQELPDDCQVVLLEPLLVANLLGITSDPATLAISECQTFLKARGLVAGKILATNQEMLAAELQHILVDGKKLHLVDDQCSRLIWQLIEKTAAVPTAVIAPVWHRVFLRWDSENVHQTQALDIQKTTEVQHQKWLQIAEKYAEKSSDWWRQVGAIAVKNDSEIIHAYNQGMPDDHTPYQYGGVRDFVATGTAPELANYIHAEQAVIAQAAARGLVLEGADLYVTHFPCPVCAKLIAKAGFKRVFFETGSATLDGKSVLEQSNVALVQVIGNLHEQ